MKMISYSAIVSIDDATRAFLQKQGYTLYLFKGINAGSGATSTVWLTLSGNQLYDQATNTITWYEDYYIGEENTQVSNGAAVAGVNPYATTQNVLSVSLGQNYTFPGSAWNPQSSGQPIDTAFTILNQEQTVNNFYVSQKVTSGPDDYIVVTELAGSGGLGTFTPIETIALILSTQPYSTGTMITEAFSPGAIITLPGISQASLAYDMNTGWSATAGQLTKLEIGNPVYDSMLTSANEALAVTGRRPGGLLGASLNNNGKTNSKNEVKGVNLKGVSNTQYSTTSKVTVRRQKGSDDKYSHVVMTDQTDTDIRLGDGVYHVSNNSGGTIQYSWLTT
jgi:hypothetical protein